MVNSKNKRRHDDRILSPEQYLRMSDHENDVAIQKAVNRLQKRIQTFLYSLDHDASRLNRREHDK